MATRMRSILLVGAMLSMLLVASGDYVMAQGTGNIDPSDFVEVIDNPYFPRIPGMRWVYEGQLADGLERVEIEILAETREVMGVTATIMRDTVYLNDDVIEDTYDWFAQDKKGNVWYFGEDVSDFDKGVLTSKTGSWEAGVDGALPGIIMFGDPGAHVGETYQQEYYAGKAEDSAILLSVTGQASAPYGDFEGLVLTFDFTPLEPGSNEIKYFAEGIGEIKTIDLATGEQSALIEFTGP